jgi:hypothetical protein
VIPCESVRCRLRCVAATTPAPVGTTSWPPAPSTGYVYQVIGTTCGPPCSCFGAGDPCFYLNGEIDSRCVYVVTTTPGPTTTTTTGGPKVKPLCCIFGAIFKAAKRGIGQDEFIAFGACSLFSQFRAILTSGPYEGYTGK